MTSITSLSNHTVLVTMRSATILGFVVSATAASVRQAVGRGLDLPLGEIGWKGVVAPGEDPIEVWGWSFEVSDSLDNCSRCYLEESAHQL